MTELGGQIWDTAVRDKLATLTCGFCGLVLRHYTQMDVDHLDGNRGNNEATNLNAICANCHRLKSYMENQNVDVSKLMSGGQSLLQVFEAYTSLVKKP